MFGVPLLGPANVFCNNQGVVHNASVPESKLAKKHNATCYHQVRELAAANIIHVAKEDTATNLADALTKPLCREISKELYKSLLYGL
jgi:hypothetical protein